MITIMHGVSEKGKSYKRCNVKSRMYGPVMDQFTDDWMSVNLPVETMWRLFIETLNLHPRFLIYAILYLI